MVPASYRAVSPLKSILNPADILLDIRGYRKPIWTYLNLEPNHVDHFGRHYVYMGLLWWLSGKESACNVGDLGSIPESGRSPGEGNGNPTQNSCLKNSMDGVAW